MADTKVLALLIVLLPVVSAAVIGLILPIRRRGMLAGTISAAVAFSTLVMSVIVLLRVQAGETVRVVVDWLPEGGKPLAQLGVQVDGISALMLFVVALVATMVQVYSLAYLSHEPSQSLGRYFTWHSLFVFSMEGLVVAPNLLQLFSCWELVGLCSYLLIGFYWEKPAAGKAAVKAFWVNKFGDAAFLIAIILMNVKYGSWDIGALQGVVASNAPGTLIPLLLFAGVMSKSAQFPLHVWLPDAMEGPTPVSALLHAATMVAAGVYLLVRFFFVFSGDATAMTVMMYVGTFTALFAALTAMVQTDIKKVLAYSTCSQLGYMVAAIGAGSQLAGFFHLFTHAFFKALLFLAAGSIIHAVHSNEMKDMGGLAKKMKLTTVLFGIGTLAIAGIPPFAGFFSKDLLLEALEHHRIAWAVGLLTAGLTAYYMGKSFFLAFMGTARTEGASHAHESGPLMTVPMGILAVLAVGAGFYGSTMARTIHAEMAPFHLTTTGIAALVMAVGGLGMAYALHGTASSTVDGPALVSSLRAFVKLRLVDRFYESLYRDVMMVLSRAIGWFDRYVIDGLMNVVGYLALEGGQGARVVQTGQPADYVFVVALGMIALMFWGYVGG